MAQQDLAAPQPSWWREVTSYQWMVLAIASAGWVFDVFEGQLFVSLKNPMLSSLVPGDAGASELAVAKQREFVFNFGLVGFLTGGALGGVLFGMMADRWGRRRIMAVTILMYSVFTGLTALVQAGWQLVVLRFLVGMGVGGEWAVAAATVAEVFPARARSAASGIFHSSSVLGTYLAVAAGFLVIGLDPQLGWRYGFFLGVLPALLVAWIRVSMREPESWQAAREAAAQDRGQRMGRLLDLFSTAQLRRHTLIGTGLGIIGLATFWGTHIRGRDLLENAIRIEERKLPEGERTANRPTQYGLWGMLLATTGGGIGLLSFAPISNRLGRRPAFLLFHLAGFAMVAVVCVLADSVWGLLFTLPIFGYFTLGMHAGYAVYFPELFPTRLRGTGAGFCFNMARIVAGPVLLGFVYLQNEPLSLGLSGAMLVLSCLFLVGAVLVWFAPETRGQPLPE